MRLGLGLGLARSTGGGGGPPAPSTLNFGATNFNKGWSGLTDKTTSGTKINLFSSSVQSKPNSIWFGMITGTDAFVAGIFQNTSSTPFPMVRVSVDGGAYTDCTFTAGEWVLFTGLPQAQHKVCIIFNEAYGASVNVHKTTTNLRVIGAPPSVEVYDNWRQVSDGNTDVWYGNSLENNGQTNYLPIETRSTSILSDRVNSMAVRGDYTKLAITSRDRYVFVSVDGAAPTRYDVGTVRPMGITISGLSGTHTYNIWNSGTDGNNLFGVGGLLATGITSLGTRKRFIQLGDSITEGVTPSTTRGNAEVTMVAAALGRVGLNSGVAGNTIGDARTRFGPLVTRLPGGATSDDVLLIALGTNNLTFVGGTDYDLNAQGKIDYPLLIADAVAQGWGLIICRSVMQSTNNNPVTANAAIQSYVTASGDPRVKYLNMTPLGVAYAGGHPDDTEYVNIRNYAVPLLQALGA